MRSRQAYSRRPVRRRSSDNDCSTYAFKYREQFAREILQPVFEQKKNDFYSSLRDQLSQLSRLTGRENLPSFEEKKNELLADLDRTLVFCTDLDRVGPPNPDDLAIARPQSARGGSEQSEGEVRVLLP